MTTATTVGDVVVLRALGLGDLLTGIPALRAVRRHYASSRVALCTNRQLRPLAELAAVADAIVPVEPFILGPLPSLACDVAVNLHGRGPQSSQRLVALRPQRLLAFRHPDLPETAGGPEWQSDEHEGDRWCRLVAGYGIPADPADLVLAAPTMPPPVRGATVVHPGAAAGARRWPPERYADVARRLRAGGHRVVVTGSAAERGLAADVCAIAGLPDEANLAGVTDVVSLAALISAACLVVSGDTGVAHLATAYERPSVVLFGPTSPAQWGPPPRPWHRVLWAGSTGDPHADTLDAGLATITVDDVVGAADAVLDTHGRGAA